MFWLLAPCLDASGSSSRPHRRARKLGTASPRRESAKILDGAVKPVLLAYASIRVTKEDSVQEIEREYWMSLGKAYKKVVAFTKLLEVSRRTLVDTIRDYIDKEHLVKSVLQCVDLSQNPKMSCESLGRILELCMGYRIQAVDLSCNEHLGNSMLVAIQPLLEAKDSHLTDLKLAQCGLTVAGLKGFLKAASKSRLRLLDISHTRISNESELIEQVLDLPMIEELTFRFCDLSPEDVRTVADGLRFTGVKSLNLAGNAFGSQGLVHLASELPESMVEVLDLSGVGIEANCEGLSQLAKAWAKRPFPILGIRNNPMGHRELINFITTLQTLVPSNPIDDTLMGNIGPQCC